MKRMVTMLVTPIMALAAMLGSVGSASAASLETWDALAQCESSGNWHINTGNGYYGGVQFSHRTWQAYGGGVFSYNAHGATKGQQILIAEKVLADPNQGWGAWPACSREIGVR